MRGLLSEAARARFVRVCEQLGVAAQVRAYYLIRSSAQDHFRILSAAHGSAWVRLVTAQAGWESSELGWPDLPARDDLVVRPPRRLSGLAEIAFARVLVSSLLRLRRAMMQSLVYLAERQGSPAAIEAMSAFGVWDNWLMGPMTDINVAPKAGAN